MQEKVETPEYNSIPMEKKLEILRNLRLMDDDFMSEVLNDNIEAVSLILRIILRRDDLIVKQVKTQNEYKSATGRSIALDVWAEDAQGKIYDIEIQRSDHGAGVRRARVHSSMLDRTLLEKGQDFEDIPDTYVIFITEHDKYKRGLPLYHLERRIEELENAPANDGTHIIYVNGEYREGDDPIGLLMQDFHCSEADDMHYRELRETVRYYKEAEGGQGQMCRAFEQLKNEGIAEGRAMGKVEGIALGKLEGKTSAQTENVRRMVKLGNFTTAQIAMLLGLTPEEVLTMAGNSETPTDILPKA